MEKITEYAVDSLFYITVGSMFLVTLFLLGCAIQQLGLSIISLF